MTDHNRNSGNLRKRIHRLQERSLSLTNPQGLRNSVPSHQEIDKRSAVDPDRRFVDNRITEDSLKGTKRRAFNDLENPSKAGKLARVADDLPPRNTDEYDEKVFDQLTTSDWDTLHKLVDKAAEDHSASAEQNHLEDQRPSYKSPASQTAEVHDENLAELYERWDYDRQPNDDDIARYLTSRDATGNESNLEGPTGHTVSSNADDLPPRNIDEYDEKVFDQLTTSDWETLHKSVDKAAEDHFASAKQNHLEDQRSPYKSPASQIAEVHDENLAELYEHWDYDRQPNDDDIARYLTSRDATGNESNLEGPTGHTVSSNADDLTPRKTDEYDEKLFDQLTTVEREELFSTVDNVSENDDSMGRVEERSKDIRFSAGHLDRNESHDAPLWFEDETKLYLLKETLRDRPDYILEVGDADSWMQESYNRPPGDAHVFTMNPDGSLYPTPSASEHLRDVKMMVWNGDSAYRLFTTQEINGADLKQFGKSRLPRNADLGGRQVGDRVHANVYIRDATSTFRPIDTVIDHGINIAPRKNVGNSHVDDAQVGRARSPKVQNTMRSVEQTDDSTLQRGYDLRQRGSRGR